MFFIVLLRWRSPRRGRWLESKILRYNDVNLDCINHPGLRPPLHRGEPPRPRSRPPLPNGKGNFPLSHGKGGAVENGGVWVLPFFPRRGNYICASIHPYPPAGYHPQNFSNFAGPESAGPLPNGKGTFKWWGMGHRIPSGNGTSYIIVRQYSAIITNTPFTSWRTSAS